MVTLIFLGGLYGWRRLPSLTKHSKKIISHLYGFITARITVDHRQWIIEACRVAQADHVADQLAHGNDHLQVYARETPPAAVLEVWPHEQVDQCARLASCAGKAGVATAENFVAQSAAHGSFSDEEYLWELESRGKHSLSCVYCCPDCLSCPTDVIQLGQATWAILAAIKKYGPKYEYVDRNALPERWEEHQRTTDKVAFLMNETMELKSLSIRACQTAPCKPCRYLNHFGMDG